MWVQAATTMGIYHAVSTSAVASTPRSGPAPQILKSDAQTQSAAAANPLQEIEQTLHTIQGIRQDVLQQLLAAVGENWDPANGTINGVPYLDYTNPLTLVYWVTRYLSVQQDFHAFLQALETNPLQLLQSLSSLTPVQIVSYLSLHPIIAGIIGSVPSVNTASVAGAAAAASSGGGGRRGRSARSRRARRRAGAGLGRSRVQYGGGRRLGADPRRVGHHHSRGFDSGDGRGHRRQFGPAPAPPA
jgi:PPE-repeat protein